MATDLRWVVDNYALCSRFSSLAVPEVDNVLLPKQYQKAAVPFMKQVRRTNFACAYGETGRTYLYPESLQAVASSFLHCKLPENSAADYKQIPGLHVLKRVTFRCNGDLVYSCNYDVLINDYFESLDDQESKRYAQVLLGYQPGAASGNAREVFLPIPMPNSHLWARGGSRGQGVMPMQSFRNSTLEVIFDFFEAKQTSADPSNPSPAMTNCEIMHKEIICPLSTQKDIAKSDSYHCVGRRLTQIQDWTTAESETETTVVVSNLSGCVQEFLIQAVAYESDDSTLNLQSPIVPSSIKMVADSVEILNRPSQAEINLLEFQHGFRANEFYTGPTYRLVFGSHGASALEGAGMYHGAINFTGISQADLRITWPEKVRYRIIANVLAINEVTSEGRFTQKLD